MRLEKINWYHFKGKHQPTSLQLWHEPRAGFGLSHFYTSTFQDQVFLDLLKYCSAAQIAELGYYFSFHNENTTATICFQARICLSGNQVCWWCGFLKMYIYKLFKYGKLSEKPISWLYLCNIGFNNFWRLFVAHYDLSDCWKHMYEFSNQGNTFFVIFKDNLIFL